MPDVNGGAKRKRESPSEAKTQTETSMISPELIAVIEEREGDPFPYEDLKPVIKDLQALLDDDSLTMPDAAEGEEGRLQSAPIPLW
ncbi:hypothetical protein TIFTF001_033234 [Ficus carica]|uniref:Uncharacterized protein n=1 Tax=Ficus carica TaxID=3494 RepID=A0AA88J6V5_FICCA|nr:hypothetical protein TIFTF001_033234 [Ficus carica]